METINLIKVWEMACENPKYKKSKRIPRFPFLGLILRIKGTRSIFIKEKYITLQMNFSGGLLQFGKLKQEFDYSEYLKLEDMHFNCSENEEIRHAKLLKKIKEEDLRNEKIKEIDFLRNEFKL